MDLIKYLGFPPKREYKKTSKGHFSRTTGKLPEKWPFGRRTKGQWLKDFEEKSNGTNNP
jgi:hypothetical protein